MEKAAIMTLEAEGEFPFEFFIEKAVPSGDDEEMILEGVASTTNIDHDSERMTKEALASMEALINEKGVPLRVEHSKEPEAIIGRVVKGWVDERNQLHIQAKLDKNHLVSPILYRAMKTGSKMGFSVGGVVKRAVQEFSEKVGGMVKTFYDVALNEVSVTPRPANYDSWAIAKSIPSELRASEKTYSQFLFENPHLDYLQVFAKSIPDGAWRKSASQPNHTAMAKDNTKTEETGDTEKAVSRSEFTSLVKTMGEGFKNIMSVLSKMTDDGAMDAVNPDTKKPEPEKVTAKAEGEAMDQNNPDEKKPDPEEVRAKAEGGRTGQHGAGKDDGSDLNGTREKSESETTEETKTKAESETETTEMKSVRDMVKSIEDLGFRIGKKADEESETMTTKKEEEQSETTEFRDKTSKDTEDETSKNQHPLDTLVMAMAKTMMAMGERLEKDGMRVPGFERNFVEKLRLDPAFQKSVQDLMKVPGFKKSVSMGVPYVPTKEGGRLALTLAPAGAPTIEKSAGAKGETFADVFKKKFSSVNTEE